MTYDILYVGTFTTHKYATDDVLAQAMKDLGHNVYRIHFNAFKNTKQVILSLVNKFDILFLGNVITKLGDDLTHKSKERNKNIKIVFWYGDQRKEILTKLFLYLKHVDVFFHTTGGKRLQEIKSNFNHLIAAFMPNPSFIMDVKPKYLADVIFTGRKNACTHIGSDDIREKTIDFLLYRKNNFLFKDIGYSTKPVFGKEYFSIIKGSKIGIGINTFNNFYKYTSDRLCHFIANGTFYLCRHFPGVNIMFEDKKHLVIWKTKEELIDKIEYYLENDNEREKIAKNGQNYILKNYNAKRIVKYIFNVIEYQQSREVWAEIYK